MTIEERFEALKKQSKFQSPDYVEIGFKVKDEDKIFYKITHYTEIFNLNIGNKVTLFGKSCRIVDIEFKDDYRDIYILEREKVEDKKMIPICAHCEYCVAKEIIRGIFLISGCAHQSNTKETLNYITGITKKEYGKCGDLNSNGECQSFEYSEKVKKFWEKYREGMKKVIRLDV